MPFLDPCSYKHKNPKQVLTPGILLKPNKVPHPEHMNPDRFLAVRDRVVQLYDAEFMAIKAQGPGSKQDRQTADTLLDYLRDIQRLTMIIPDDVTATLETLRAHLVHLDLPTAPWLAVATRAEAYSPRLRRQMFGGPGGSR